MSDPIQEAIIEATSDALETLLEPMALDKPVAHVLLGAVAALTARDAAAKWWEQSQ